MLTINTMHSLKTKGVLVIFLLYLFKIEHMTSLATWVNEKVNLFYFLKIYYLHA